jgi:hypothetical protein
MTMSWRKGSWHKGTLVMMVLAVGLAIAALPATAASAGGTAASGADRWASPAGQQFAAAVYRCEDETARGTLHDLQACVGGLVGPDPTQAAIFDLWSIFRNCLSIMMDAGPDAPYPTPVYEERVNQCLGL